MSDPTIEEDSLISQDDIDKLMESSSVDDLDENFPPSDDELGELSQDDIDSLLNSNATAPEPSGEDDEDEEMELISQNDIDQLMNSGALVDDDRTVIAEDLDAAEDLDISGDDDFGELSQDDIDSLVNPKASSDEILNNATEDTDEDDFEMISQNDINTLMSGSGDTDIVEKAVAPFEPVSDTQADNDVIDESQSVEIQDALITQQTLDDLIKNFKNEPESVPEPEPVILDEILEPEAATEEIAAPKDRPEASSDQTADEDDFLIPDTDSGELGLGDNEDVSQSDIDALLLDDDEGQSDDDILISQDDIDTLLMAADQEDEDVLGDLMDDSMDSGLDDDLLDEDIMETEEFELDADGGDDQVVLEEGGDVVFKPGKQKKKTRSASDPASKWYKSKLLIACASALLVLGITVPVAYFIFSSDKPVDPRAVSYTPVPPTPVTVEKSPATAVEREVTIETVDVNVQEPFEYKKSGNMILQDFVVLASDMSRELAYITADISIDYSDQRAYHEINNNLSYYRDVIYEAISSSLAFEKMEETTEDDILLFIEKALKKVLPEQYIKKVSFKSFKAS